MICHLAKASPSGYTESPSTPLVLHDFSLPETPPEAATDVSIRRALECMYAAFKTTGEATATQAVALEIAYRALKGLK